MLVHNHYGHFATGGEAHVVATEEDLLRQAGTVVERVECTNARRSGESTWSLAGDLYRSDWSRAAYSMMSARVLRFRPDVVHVHNYWFRFSPSVLQAAWDVGVATVMTVHNYRLLCPGVLFFRDGRPCEDCLTRSSLWSLVHRCHSGSLARTALSLRLHRATRRRGLLAGCVNRFIALSEFMKSRLVAGGIPSHLVSVKPNCAPDPLASGGRAGGAGAGAVYVGRLTAEKGLDDLLEAWRGLDYPLTVVGGPVRPVWRDDSRGGPVRFLGELPREQAIAALHAGSFLVFPSRCYEGLPLVVLEAMALGRPVIACDVGGRSELVHHGVNGLLYALGDLAGLRSCVRTFVETPSLRTEMGQKARDLYLREYTPERNIHRLLAVYEEAIAEQRGPDRAPRELR
jgi:glycosyltransferase involved in cell wall biosynthesis